MRHRLLPLLILGALATVAPALAYWPPDPTTGGVQLSSLPMLGQFNPQPLADGAGGMFVVYQVMVAVGNSDIYVQHVDASGNLLWGADGVVVCAAPNVQQIPHLCSDGAGGVIIAWLDSRNLGTTGFDLYAQRVSATGVPQWTADGVVVCNASGTQFGPFLVPDGASGAIITWYDQRSGNFDIYAQRLNAAGVPLWAPNGLAICNAANDQIAPYIVSDDAGGAIIVWDDFRNGGDHDIYAQHVNATGAALWAANGLGVATAIGDQMNPGIVADGAGGAVITWQDGRVAGDVNIWAQRLDPTGASLWGSGIIVCGASGNQSAPVIVADGTGGGFIEWSDARSDASGDLYAQHVGGAGIAQWATDGVAVCTAPTTQFSYSLVADGSGGAIFSWDDSRTGLGHDVYAQRFDAAGTARFLANGMLVSNALMDQLTTTIASDGRGGALLAWADHRATPLRVFAQRVDHFGPLGDPSPSIGSVHDVPDDNGGFVTVTWGASYLDADPIYGVTDYRLWRAAPLAIAARVRAQRATTSDPDLAARTGALLVLPGAAQTYSWQYVATEPAAALPSYEMVAATTGDSTGAANPPTAFMVEAQATTTLGAPHWFSAAASGYSVDNLPPPPPTPFLGTYAAGVALLSWGVDPAPDLAGYRLYRGASASFVPSPSNLILATALNAYSDAAGAPYYYRLTAVDIHGNESASTLLLPSGALAVDTPALPRTLALAAPAPNPARNATTLRFALPGDAIVRLALFDVSGRRVRMLVDGARAAGEHEVAWDLRDDAGRVVSAGLYLARLEAAGSVRFRRLMALSQ